MRPNLDACSSSPNATSALRVLIVEDNPVNQLLTQRLATKAGCHCQLVENGSAAISVTAENEFDLILMDIQMPVMDGITATKLIREREIHRGTHVLVAALTAHILPDDQNICFSAGMDYFLRKPLSKEALMDLLSEVRAKVNSREHPTAFAP